MINRAKELNKLGKLENDNTYLSIYISSQIEKKGKEIDIERNELYSALFLMMGLDKNSVSTNMEHLYGGDVKEKLIKALIKGIRIFGLLIQDPKNMKLLKIGIPKIMMTLKFFSMYLELIY